MLGKLRNKKQDQTHSRKSVQTFIAASRAIESLESRLMLAAHIAGSSTVYSTIQAAVDAAPAGATINVDPGHYAELVTVYKTLTIHGAQAGMDARTNTRAASGSANESVITGSTGSSGVSSAFYIAASDVTIDGFTVQGNTSATYYGAGIVIAPSQHGTHILNNIIQNNVTGLYLSNNSATDQCVIQHNYFLNNNNVGNNGGRAIYTDSGVSGGNLTNVLIDGNAIIVNKIPSGGPAYEGGIAIEGRTLNSQSNITITNNLLDGTGKLLIYNASNITIEYNTVTHQTDQWSGTLRFEGGVTNAVIKYNNVFDNNGPGLSVDSKGFAADDAGFVVEYNNFYNNNTIYKNKLSIVVTESAYDGTFDARNNWFGSASGPGGQGPGTGDTIYGNGQYLKGANSGWSTVAGDEMSFTPFSTAPNGSEDNAYWGVPAAAGAPIQAEDFNQGGNGVGYFSAAASNGGGQYRIAEKIGIEASTDTGGGYDVSYTAPGQWMDYTTNLTAGGTYNLAFRVANAQSVGGTFNLNVDGKNVTGTLTAPNTGGWQTWQTVTVNNISLAAGQHVLRLMIDGAGSGGSVANFNWIELIPVNTVSVPVAPSNVVAIASSATNVSLTWQEASAGISSFQIQRSTDGVTFSNLATVAGTATSYIDTAAVSGAANTYRISATNTGGTSPYSAAVVATTPAIATAPTALLASALSATQVKLTWTDTAPAVETGFLIERGTDGVTFAQIGSTASGVVTYTDSTVAGGTSYTYRVRATSAGGNSAYGNTSSTTTPAAGAITTYVSDLAWTSATSGWLTVQKNLSIAGNAITLNGVTYPKGLGVHAVSQVVYNLGGNYTSFLSDIGIDAEENGKGVGSVDFQVIGDGKVLFDSGVLTNASPTVSVSVNVTGVSTLTLLANNGVTGSIDYDHADWAGARLIASTAQPPAAPSGLTAVTSSATQVNLNWANNAVNATGFVIQRGTDGVNFTQVGTTAVGVTTFFDATGLAAGTTYTYRVLATSAAGNSAPSATASATTLSSTAVVTYATSLPWVSATSGWATVQPDLTVSSNPITLRGVSYARGLGTHAVSQIVYNLGGAYTNFISDVGVDDEENGKGIGSVDFQVIGDGKVLFDSGVVTNTSPIVSLNVNVTGVQQLTLVATNGIAGSIDYDHADWAGARLISTPAAPLVGAPKSTTAAITTPTTAPSTGTGSVGSPKTIVAAVPALKPALPAPWVNASVGAVGRIGSASETAGLFSVTGAGARIGGTTDSFDFAYQSLTGNGTIVARVASLPSTGGEAGVMIRETLGDTARAVSLLLTGKSASFVHRAKIATSSVVTTRTKVSAPQWVKLSRKGTTFTASISVDGVHWSQIGTASISMNATVYIGLAATSQNATILSTATFDQVSVA